MSRGSCNALPAAILVGLGLASADVAGALPCANSALFDVQHSAADSGVTQVLAADLDGEAAADLVLVSAGRRTFEVQLHVAGTHFTRGSSWTWPNAVRRALVADLDHDGYSDLAFTDGASQLVLYRGTGAGTLELERVVVLAYPGFDLVVGDFGNGGALEIVVSHPSSGKITTLLSTSGFVYELVTTDIASRLFDPNRLALGHIDGDGILDLALSRSTNSQVLLYRGGGTAGVGNGALIYWGTVAMGSTVTALRLVDVDGDARHDLVAGTTSSLSWMYGNGLGQFSSPAVVSFPGTMISDFDVVDLDRDSHLDVLCARPTVDVVTRIAGRGQRQFERGPDFELPGSPQALAKIDAGGTGDHDFAVATRASPSVALLVSRCEPLMDEPLPVDIRPIGAPVPPPTPPPLDLVALPPPPYPDPGPHPVVAAWPQNGVVICDAPGRQSDLRGTDDFAHGAYFAWVDERHGENDIYAIRLGPDGLPSGGWLADGNAVCRAAGSQRDVTCVTDGPWGVWICWIDEREGISALYSMKLLHDGSRAPGWPVDGRRICTSTPSTVVGAYQAWADRYGGLVIAWRFNGQTATVRLNPDGSARSPWPECGSIVQTDSRRVTTCTDAGTSVSSMALHWPDGIVLTQHAFGQFCYWEHEDCVNCRYENHTTFHVHDSPASVSDIGFDQFEGKAFADDEGGWYFLNYWTANLRRYRPDDRLGWIADLGGGGNLDLIHGVMGQFHVISPSSDFANAVLRLEDDGSWSPAFGASGRALCEDPCGRVGEVRQALDGQGGVLAVWRDWRRSTTGEAVCDLYGTCYRADGIRGPGWRSDGEPIATTDSNEQLMALVGNRRGSAIVAWSDDRNGNSDLFAYRLTSQAGLLLESGRHATPEAGSSSPRSHDLALIGARPNPSNGRTILEFSLSRVGRAAVRIVDVAGRELGRREWASLSAGRHRVEFGELRDAPSGIYVMELVAEGRRLRSKVVLTR